MIDLLVNLVLIIRFVIGFTNMRDMARDYDTSAS